MSANSTARSYYIFMFFMPLVFFYGISDRVLLPRQLFLTFFAALSIISVIKIIKKDGAIRLDTINLAMIAYFLIAVGVSLCRAAVISESLYFTSKLWILISFSLLTVTFLNKKAISISQIVNAVVIFGCVAIATAMLDITNKTINGAHLFRAVHIVSGNFANKNLLSSILFLCLPFFMIGCKGQKRLRMISYLALFLTIFILLIVRTRAVLIATVIFFGIAAFFLFKDFLKRRIWWIVALLLAVTVAGIFQFRIYEAVGGFKSSSDIHQQYLYRLFDNQTFKSRMLFWENSLEMFREYPLGVGLGNWQIYFPKYGLGKFNSYDMVAGIHTLQRPHNDFLWILCETGILGFTAFIAIFGIFIYQSLSLIKTAGSQYERQLFVYLFAAVIGFMFIAFFDFPMERIEHQIVLLLIFAIVMYQYRLKNSNSFTFPVNKVQLLLFIAFGICFSFTVSFRRIQSERQVYNLYKFREAKNAGDVIVCAQNAENSFYKLDSKSIPLKWYMGSAYFSKGQFLQAEDCFAEAYATTPYSIHVINNLASSYETNGKSNDAVKMYQKALQISPGFEEARLNLAAVYFNSKAYEKAFETIDYCSVQTRDPKYKIFLPPILKSKAAIVLSRVNFPVSTETKKLFANLQDYSQLYYESKKNNITFERQLISQLKK